MLIYTILIPDLSSIQFKNDWTRVKTKGSPFSQPNRDPNETIPTNTGFSSALKIESGPPLSPVLNYV